MTEDIRQRHLLHELTFAASRSIGPGGQNVNKVASKIELRFHVASSLILSDEEKQLVFAKASGKINKEGYLQLFSQASRSQLVNKQSAIVAFYTLLLYCFSRKKPRMATQASKSSKIKRLKSKKMLSEKKKFRSVGDPEE